MTAQFKYIEQLKMYLIDRITNRSAGYGKLKSIYIYVPSISKPWHTVHVDWIAWL